MAEAMATSLKATQLIRPRCGLTHSSLLSPPSSIQLISHNKHVFTLSNKCKLSGQLCFTTLAASPKNDKLVEADEDDGVQLGTMKLPPNLDIARFETLLFQWGNSLCQGATLPLPMPLKVDKIAGGVRLGFIVIEDARTETPVYIDCLVYPSTETSGPVFRAIRNGPTKDRSPPGEPRIMTSLQEALKKSVAIATA